jgi:hypothetical protein
MDHQAFAQLLGSYGEFFGAIAVVITLIYFGVQLRKTEIATKNSTASAMQVARVDSNNQQLEHAELILKANTGAELTDADRTRLQILFQSEYQIMLFTFMNQLRVGENGDIQARNFSRFLANNRAMEEIWNFAKDRVECDFRGVENPMLSAWLESVTRHLIEVKSNRTMNLNS